jgi:hypothetical protein
MSRKIGFRNIELTEKVLVTLNLCLWIYFWTAFAKESHPFQPDPLGHPAGTGYTFWGHSIAVGESGLLHPFFKTVFYAELPSFTLATLIVQVFSPHLLINGFFAGISGGGWLLLGVMVLSFFQWCLIGWGMRKLWQKWFGPPAPTLRKPGTVTP